MATLKEEALNHENAQTKNIADLEAVETTLQVYDEERTDADGKPFRYKYIELNSEKYRVPASVFAELQEILKVKPDLKVFKVSKTGSGLNTKYKVIQL